MPLDRDTGKPRGFAFIEYDDPEHASRAIAQFNQKPFLDRPLVVNEARPSEARGAGPRPAGPRGPSFRPPSGPPRGPAPGPRGFEPPGEERTPARRSSPAKPKRRGGKRAFWDDGPKKAPIPEKRRNQLLGGFDEGEEEEVDVEFDDFATSLPEDEDED
jgi:RNA recognition motif-containing protein